MQPSTFKAKAKLMGDFHLVYKRPDEWYRQGMCTADLDNKYIQSKLRNTRVKEGEVLLWNWDADAPLRIDPIYIKKMIPLESLLKNGRF